MPVDAAGFWTMRHIGPRARVCVAAGAVLLLATFAGACSEIAAPLADGESPALPGQTAQVNQSTPCSTLTAGAIVCPANDPNVGAGSWRTVTSGGEHTCALRADAALFCWGSDRDGQLGTDNVAMTCGGAASAYLCSTTPVRAQAALTFAAVSAGARHTCAITAALQAVCWGANDAGQLGSASPAGSSTALLVPGGSSWIQISAGFSHSCAVRIDGAAYCWGANERGQLGNGNALSVSGPVAVALPERVVSVSAGQSRTCGKTAAGVVYCWGLIWTNRSQGFEMSRSQSVPQIVAGSAAMTGVSVGAFTTCGVDRLSTAVCWEGNPRGQIGNGSQDGATSPVPVAGTGAFVQVSAGLVQSCGITMAGAAYCWGDDTFGQLGSDPRALSERCDTQALPCSTVPLTVQDAPRFSQISTGLGSHTCAVTTIGEIYCWGLGVAGQLGDGTTSGIRPRATRIAAPTAG